MSKVFSYIKEFYQQGFHAGYFVFILLMMGLLIYSNYKLGIDSDWIGRYSRQYKMIFGYWILFAGTFAMAYIAYSLFTNHFSFWKEPGFILLLIIAPLIFAYQQYFYFHRELIRDHASNNMISYYSLASEYVIRVILILIPTFLIWTLFDKNNQPFYGFTGNTEGYRPYWIMLAFMIPLIIFASTQKDFLQYYPKAKIIASTGATGWRKLWLTIQFELAYGFNFLTIESFFRGFLILAFVQYTGKAAIIPMACFYCTIHFGKPVFECISSFFGGLLLGIVVYNTKSIWGGLMVHLGIAWLMEAGAIIGNFLRK